MVVDVHTHILPPEYLDKLMAWGSRRFEVAADAAGRTILKYKGARFLGVTKEMASTEDRLRDMDRIGVDLQVVSLSCPNVYFVDGQDAVWLARAMNDHFAAVCRQHPDRLKGMASLPLTAGLSEALKELDRATQELGMVGVILGSHVGGTSLAEPAFEPLFARLDHLRLPVFLHPMEPLPAEHMRDFGLAPMVGFMFETTLTVARMVYAGVFDRHPNFPFIVPHLGATLPYLMERLDNGYRAYRPNYDYAPHLPSHYYRRLYYDTVSFHRPALTCAVMSVGTDRLVMGSDYPHVIGDLQRAVASIQELDVPRADQQKILGETARQIFRL